MDLVATAGVSLKPYTTLRAGGVSELFAVARSVDELAKWTIWAQKSNDRATILGWGSNVLPSDAGVPGLCVVNDARRIDIGNDGAIVADAGCGFQELFLKSAQAGLKGLEFAVGIPGTLGGALVSNAGAYRSCVSEFLVAIEIVAEGERKWVDPSFMKFSYRDSVLRSENPPAVCLLRVKLQLERGPSKAIYDEAREYQRQRIGKQPPPASAGSFFKNVYDKELAESLDNLPENLKRAGVVPSGYLIEKAGLKGLKHKGAELSAKHANFIVNSGDASATSIRSLAEHAKRRVFDQFGATIEEEALYLGDWSRFEAEVVDE